MIPLLITSSIIASAPKTMLSNSSERLLETIKALGQWIEMGVTDKIIVCDGSNFDLAPHIANVIPAYEKIELIRFQNDLNMISRKGKGWGEGEIIKFALKESEVLRSATQFMKCTAKLWVTNAEKCARNFNGEAAFDYEGRFSPHKIDTRFYIVSKRFYIQNLLEAHESVSDLDGFYLEHAFCEALAEISPARYVMTPTPRVMGVSGSMGISYKNSRLKSAFRNIRSQLFKVISPS